ncbi:MAG TPA: CapA family protein [Clostridiales bacterium]|nr:CapA family protein [Clostridiales bacterium]HQP69950.1 CapA family protein [Clostridiales bacterium]
MKLDFIGDVYLNNKVDLSQKLNLNNIILNLEAPFNNKGIPAENKVNLYMDPNFFLETFNPNTIAAVNLANNHIMDFGEEAYNYTIKILKENKIPYFGVGNIEDKFNNPLIIKDKFALFGYACKSTNGVFGTNEKIGAALFDLDKTIIEIDKYRGKYFIIINIHWGQEYFSFPKPEDVVKARKLVDSGADLIIGHHTHKIQSYEKYRGKYIFYSIGNAIFHDGVVPSKYDGRKFQKKYRMKYKRANRISFKVTIDSDKNIVSKRFIYYDKFKLRLHNSPYLRIKTRFIFKGFLYKIYSVYKRISFSFKYHLEKVKNESRNT